jgi:hypothetical protein
VGRRDEVRGSDMVNKGWAERGGEAEEVLARCAKQRQADDGPQRGQLLRARAVKQI